MAKIKSLILASASPRRAELLRSIGIHFEVLVSPDKEPHRKPAGIPTELWPACLAYIKAKAIQKILPSSKRHRLILAADTIVVEGNRILNKSPNRAHAKKILQSLNHKPHHVITGICLLTNSHLRLTTATATCKLHFTPAQLESYLDSNLWKGKAGAYGIQDSPNKKDPFITLLTGHLSTVIGLPLSLLQSELRHFPKD